MGNRAVSENSNMTCDLPILHTIRALREPAKAASNIAEATPFSL